MTMPVGPHMPDLDALSLLVEVARGGSIGAAARSQGISQQAASERLQAIERQVGVPLLQRGSRGSTPTPAGAVLVEWSTRLLTVADEVEAAIGSLRTGRDRELRIVASMTIAEHLLPRWLVLLRRHQTTRGRPLSVSLTATNSREAVASVTRGDADLGFVEGANAPTGLGVLDISADELVLTASPSDPLTRRRRPLRPHDVAALALTSRELGSGTREIVDLALTAHGLTPVPAAAEFTTSTAVREAIRAGSPPGFLSLRTIGDELRSGALVVIPTAGLALERTFRAIWPADRDRRPGRPGSCSGLRRVRDGVVDRPAFRRRVTVFDRADVGALISPAEDANVGPDPAKLAAIVQEFLRQQAIFPAAVVGRTDWLLGQEACTTLG